jgi:hypothetical protein
VVAAGSLKGELAAARQRINARPGRRTRRAYALTETGRQLFAELLREESVDDDRAFALKLSFCRYLSSAQRLAFLERRRAQLTQRLATSKRAPSARAVDRYTRSLLEHRASSTEHDLEWIEGLIAQERAEQSDHPEGATP